MTENYSGVVVQVSSDDIKYGKQQAIGHCAIARSIARAWPDEARYVRVDSNRQTIAFTDITDRRRRTWKVPANVLKWIVNFDQGKAVRPIKFQLTELVDRKPMGARPSTRVGKGPQTAKVRAVAKAAKAAAKAAGVATPAVNPFTVPGAKKGKAATTTTPVATAPAPKTSTGPRTYRDYKLA